MTTNSARALCFGGLILESSVKKLGQRVGAGETVENEDIGGIYHPFSLLNALDSLNLKNYWFETGTPT